MDVNVENNNTNNSKSNEHSIITRRLRKTKTSPLIKVKFISFNISSCKSSNNKRSQNNFYLTDRRKKCAFKNSNYSKYVQFNQKKNFNDKISIENYEENDDNVTKNNSNEIMTQKNKNL